jgi:hypothetical protein
VKGDAELLERRLSGDFSFTHAGGTTETKNGYLSRVRRIPSRYFFARDVSRQVVEIHGDVALVVGRLDIRGLGRRQIRPKPRLLVPPLSTSICMPVMTISGSLFRTEQLSWSSSLIRAPRNGTLADAAGLAPGSLALPSRPQAAESPCADSDCRTRKRARGRKRRGSDGAAHGRRVVPLPSIPRGYPLAQNSWLDYPWAILSIIVRCGLPIDGLFGSRRQGRAHEAPRAFSDGQGCRLTGACAPLPRRIRT